MCIRDRTWNYEIGTHLNLLDGRLHADAAIFWLETRDQQISRFAPRDVYKRQAYDIRQQRIIHSNTDLSDVNIARIKPLNQTELLI